MQKQNFRKTRSFIRKHRPSLKQGNLLGDLVLFFLAVVLGFYLGVHSQHQPVYVFRSPDAAKIPTVVESEEVKKWM